MYIMCNNKNKDKELLTKIIRFTEQVDYNTKYPKNTWISDWGNSGFDYSATDLKHILLKEGMFSKRELRQLLFHIYRYKSYKKSLDYCILYQPILTHLHLLDIIDYLTSWKLDYYIPGKSYDQLAIIDIGMKPDISP